MRRVRSSQVKRAIESLLIIVAVAFATIALSVGGGDQRAEARSQAAPQVAHQKPAKKLSHRLQILSQPATRAASAAAQAAQVSLPETGPGSLTRDASGQLLVYIRVADVSSATRQALQAAGATVRHVSGQYRTITALTDAGRLSNLEALPRVQYVEEVLTPFHVTVPTHELTQTIHGAQPRATVCSPIVSEGDAQLNASMARSSFGLDGSGVTVGILSDTYDQYASAHTRASTDILSGDLPGPGNPCGRVSAVNVISTSLTSTGVYDEGRAMAQIVHDLAPGADLAFASAWNGLFEFADNVRNLRSAGANIIVDDVFYYAEPMFQDGPISVAISEVTAAGALYFTAAGNENITIAGQSVSSYETPTYRPTACPSMSSGGTLVPGVDIGLTCHNFDTSGTDTSSSLTLSAGQSLDVDIQWAEPWYGVTTDIDVFLVDQANRKVLARSIADSPGSGQPFEFFRYTNNTGTSKTVDIVINRWNDSGTPRLKYIVIQPSYPASVEYGTSSGGDIVGPSIFGHAAASSAISMAAVPYNDSTSPEPYTSHGPATHYFGPIVGTSPAAPLPSPELVQKPDLAATDGGGNTFFGNLIGGTYRFYGTSAAAPHAAAVAALMKQNANGRGVTLDQNLARSILRSTARTVSNGTPSSVGAGLIDALAANQQVQALPPPDTTVPLITSAVTGTMSSNGWYTGAVTVTWTVSDPESGIASSSGCDPNTLAVDTAGTTLTCTATNAAGLSNSSSLTIRIDQTPPTITGAATTNPNSAGWYTSTVTVHWTCGDAISGLAEACPADSILTANGAGQSVSASVNDNAGHTASASVSDINIDTNARPDLVASDLVAPAAARPGQVIPITWTVTNQGHAEAMMPWYDRVYLSTDDVWDATDIFVTNVTHTLGLMPGSNYSVSQSITAPWVTGGNHYLIARTDMWNNVTESDETNNVRGLPIVIGTPDLTPTSLLAPARAEIGQTIPITWTVKNQGLSDTLPTWYDRVYLSTDAMWDSGDLLLSNVTHTLGLAPGSSYSASQNVMVPWVTGDSYYLILRADMWNQVAESDETDNVRMVPITVGTPDLTPIAFSAPPSAIGWQVITATWTIKNQGHGDAPSSWQDRIYLSTDAAWDSGDTWLTTVTHTATLTYSSSYSVTQSLVVPKVASGSYYLLLRTDMWNQVNELDETNNLRLLPINIGPPDLTPTEFLTPAAAKPGQSIPLTWTVRNQGPSDTRPTWYDRVYLSTDLTYDSGDTLLVNVTRTFTLLPGASYATSRAANLPRIAPGSYYLILRTDMWGNVTELDETNNERTVPLVIGLPDLTPTAFTVPATAGPWQVVSATWTVKNQGPIDAVPSWEDRVYLSADPTWGSGDIFLTKVTHSSTVVARDGYTVSANLTLPGLTGRWKTVHER